MPSRVFDIWLIFRRENKENWMVRILCLLRITCILRHVILAPSMSFCAIWGYPPYSFLVSFFLPFKRLDGVFAILGHKMISPVKITPLKFEVGSFEKEISIFFHRKFDRTWADNPTIFWATEDIWLKTYDWRHMIWVRLTSSCYQFRLFISCSFWKRGLAFKKTKKTQL